MKKKEPENLRTQKRDELLRLSEEKRLEIEKTLAEVAAGREKNLKKVRRLKLDLAQILTVIREKELTEKDVNAKKA